MRQFAYGRRPPAPRGPKQLRAALLMSGALDALGAAPPQSIDYVSAVGFQFNSYDNEDIGDCVPTDTANSLILRTANADGAPVIPTLSQVVGLYSTVGGYVIGNEATDNGCDVEAMCNYMVTTGFLGHKAAATGNVDHTNLDHCRWAQRLFGTCRLGWNLPGYAEDLFMAGKRWDVQSTGDQSIEGHDTAMVDYGPDGTLYVVSWFNSAAAYERHLVPVTPAFAAKYLEEASADVFPDWIAAQGIAPSGFDIADLTAKLKEVA